MLNPFEYFFTISCVLRVVAQEAFL